VSKQYNFGFVDRWLYNYIPSESFKLLASLFED